MIHRRESATRKRSPGLQKTPTLPTPESDFKKAIIKPPAPKKPGAFFSSAVKIKIQPPQKPAIDRSPLRRDTDILIKPAFYNSQALDFLSSSSSGKSSALISDVPSFLFSHSKANTLQTQPVFFLQGADKRHISEEHTRPGAAAPTARVVNPVLSAFGLTTLFSNWYNRKIDHYRIGDNRPFLKGWGKTPQNSRIMGHGPDVVGTITDLIGLGLNELHYVPQIREKIKDAEQKGDVATAEKWNRSLLYGRVNTYGTLISLVPTLKPGDRRYFGSRFGRMPIALAKSAIMMDGIQQDYKNGLLNKRDAAAYSFSGAVRAGIAAGRLVIINNRLRKYTDVINNVAYDIDMGSSAIENVFISWSGLVRGQTQPIDAWAEIYRRVAPEGLDDTMLAASDKVNKGMDYLGMHNKDSALRQKLSYLTGDWRNYLPGATN